MITKVKCNNERAERMAAVLQKAGVNLSAVTVLGVYVHIDSYQKYDELLRRYLTKSGFTVVKVSNGRHMSDYVGYRMVVKAK